MERIRDLFLVRRLNDTYVHHLGGRRRRRDDVLVCCILCKWVKVEDISLLDVLAAEYVSVSVSLFFDTGRWFGPIGSARAGLPKGAMAVFDGNEND